ncbi:MAG: SBBP repeat-containing protein [Candidatus Thermoplasmatota archaeon]|nr:SBBP repeat-containing protein [Candidatus Thermoplasmatota archaeon]MBU4071944.1 SBBP repeat-containing protein [Candidatus Thermoplasmatota archaeon]MBU4143461.1 SBBP repeat-containing protein [Candidatus Thermoplasmatota archaeon]MBU4591448.1 SBBP repeat-containing protein [Candidatus Thermoplasmatota archaeon]
MMRKIIPFILVGMLLFCAFTTSWPPAGIEYGASPLSATTETPEFKTEMLANVFTQNLGQIDGDDVMLYSSSGDAAFTRGSVLIYTPGNVLVLSFLNSNDVAPRGINPASWKSNYFLGNDSTRWHIGVSNYHGVVYEDIWDGIDLIYSMKDGGIKYDFMVAPGTDHRQIMVRLGGHESLSVTDGGELSIGLGTGDFITDSDLEVFYADMPDEKLLAGFELMDASTYMFRVEGRDMSRAMTIDPLVYSTFLGGSGSDHGTAVAVDSEGNAHVTGYTGLPNFPTTPGIFQFDNETGQDVFIVKLDGNGTSILYTAFLGGDDYDVGHSIAVDGEGNALVAGETFSADFPTSSSTFDRSYNGVGDAFVAKIGPMGDSLLYSTYLGGKHDDAAYGIAVNGQGQIYVTGYTWSTTFPTTPGALANRSNGDSDAFVTKLSQTGDYLVYSTYLGGSGSEKGTALTVDADGNAYVAGTTRSSNFPVTAGAINIINSSNDNVFVTKLAGSGNAQLYSAVFGGSGPDTVSGIAIDSQGNAHVAGDTLSKDFPTVGGAFDETPNGGSDIFAAKLNVSGGSFLYSTYLGGSRDDVCGGLALDADGNAFITGHTVSMNFPMTVGAIQKLPGGGEEVFISMLNDTGQSLHYSTYLGGSLDDVGTGICLSSTGCAFVTGETVSADFPVPADAPWPSASRDGDAFLAKFDITAPLAMAGPDMFVNESNWFSFNGTASSDNEGIVNYTWSFNDGTGGRILQGPAPTYFFVIPGIYNVTLNVTDFVGNVGSDIMILTVLVYPIPIAEAGSDLTLNESSAVNFDGSASRDNKGIVDYLWGFNDGINNVALGGTNPAWTFRVPGKYEVTLTVWDADGYTDSDNITVHVLDVTGPATALEPSMAMERGSAIHFNAFRSVDNVEIVNYTWTLTHNGTETTLYGPNSSFTFWESGDHEVVLTVTDSAGNQNSDVVLVSVIATENQFNLWPPVAMILLAVSILVLCAVLLSSRKRKGEKTEAEHE